MAEDEAELGEVSPVVGILVEHLLLAFLEELDGLLALAHQVLDEDLKVLFIVEGHHVILILGGNEAQVLVGIGQNVEDEWRGILQVHLRVLARLHHLVHQLERLFQRPPVYQLGWRHSLRKGPVQLGEEH